MLTFRINKNIFHRFLNIPVKSSVHEQTEVLFKLIKHAPLFKHLFS
jgi:hypothetical protein